MRVLVSLTEPTVAVMVACPAPTVVVRLVLLMFKPGLLEMRFGNG